MFFFIISVYNGREISCNSVMHSPKQCTRTVTYFLQSPLSLNPILIRTLYTLAVGLAVA